MTLLQHKLRKLYIKLALFAAVLMTFTVGSVGLAQGKAAEKVNYILKARDTIQLIVFGEDDLGAEVQLTNKGEASFELIKPIILKGMTLEEANAAIEKAYIDGEYLIHPKVSVKLKGSADESIDVMGAVMTPGAVVLPKGRDMDLLGAIAMAGNFSPTSNKNKIYLTTGGVQKSYSYEDLKRPGASPILVKVGDAIWVEESKFVGKEVTMAGEIKVPGPMPFPLDGKLDLLQAIHNAKGLTMGGYPNGITLNRGGRISSHKLSVLEAANAKLIPLKPGDLIIIGRSPFVGKYVTITGWVKNPGKVEFPADGKMDIRDAIAELGGLKGGAKSWDIKLTRTQKGGKRTTTKIDLDKINKGGKTTKLLPGDNIHVPERRI